MSCVAEPNDMDVLVHFSSFLFSRLSATHQCEKTNEIRQNFSEDVLVLKAADRVPEESEEDSRLRTFAELFKKLAVAEQNRFLSSELNRYEQEEEFQKLAFWFQELEADDQRELIKKLDPITPEDVQIHRPGDDDTTFSSFMRLPNESLENFRVRRFTESCNRLQYSSQKYIVAFFPESSLRPGIGDICCQSNSCESKEDSDPFINELIKFKAPNLRGAVVPPTSQEGNEVVDHLALDFDRSMR